MSEISTVERAIDNLGLFVCIPKRSSARAMCTALQDALAATHVWLIPHDREALSALLALIQRAFGDDEGS